jgi:hypothetical protein
MDTAGGRRAGTFEDFNNLIKLCQHFDVIHTLGGAVEPQDIPVHIRHLEMTRSQLLLSDKVPFVFSRGSGQIADNFELLRLAHGFTPEQFRATPVTWTVINTNSPLQLDIPMAGAIEFDSASKPEEATEEADDEGPMGGMGMPSGAKLAAGLREIAGKSFTADVAADGSILGVAGFDEARKAAKKAFGMAGQMMEGAINDRGLQNLVRGAIGYLPKEAVAAGATWETKVDAGSQMPMEQSLKMTLGTVGADEVEFAYSGESKMKEGARMPMPDAEVEGGKIEGSAKISRKDGFTISSKQTSNMSIFATNATVSAGPPQDAHARRLAAESAASRLPALLVAAQRVHGQAVDAQV